MLTLLLEKSNLPHMSYDYAGLNARKLSENELTGAIPENISSLAALNFL